jgi:hypothetical protein
MQPETEAKKGPIADYECFIEWSKAIVSVAHSSCAALQEQGRDMVVQGIDQVSRQERCHAVRFAASLAQPVDVCLTAKR